MRRWKGVDELIDRTQPYLNPIRPLIWRCNKCQTGEEVNTKHTNALEAIIHTLAHKWFFISTIYRWCTWWMVDVVQLFDPVQTGVMAWMDCKATQRTKWWWTVLNMIDLIEHKVCLLNGDDELKTNRCTIRNPTKHIPGNISNWINVGLWTIHSRKKNVSVAECALMDNCGHCNERMESMFSKAKKN